MAAQPGLFHHGGRGRPVPLLKWHRTEAGWRATRDEWGCAGLAASWPGPTMVVAGPLPLLAKLLIGAAHAANRVVIHEAPESRTTALFRVDGH